VADSLVDPKFGNGALKVTPRHDVLDFEISRRHPELPMPPSILTEGADLTGEWVPQRFRGMDRDKARTEVTRALESEGVVERSESIRHSVGRSERTDAVIEPMLSTQWFVRMRPLAGPVVEAVRKGEVRIHPERWTLTFFRWMEELEDWCISRQVVWGHPIPVYHCGQCQRSTAAVSAPPECPFCGALDLAPDPDVLDTWFTSWLWPFASLGWPDPTPELEHYYPTSVLVTGRDIMFFWVARMLMAGFYFTGRRPFSDVVYTGMLRDDQGRRMSKHLGNSPDPLDLIRERGADALRFALVFPNPVDQDGPFGAATLDGARNFLTKLWNLGRLAGQHTPEGTEPPRHAPRLGSGSALADRWVLSRWHATAEEVGQALEAYEFTRAAGLLYGFLWHDFADRYVEVSKESLMGRRGEPAARDARETLRFVLERALRMLHPFAPHVTEELWHALPHDGDLLALARWPATDEVARDREAEAEMEIILDAVRVGRNLKADHNVPAASRPVASVRPANPSAAAVLREHAETVVRLARLERLDLMDPGSPNPDGAASAVTPAGEFFVVLPPEAKEAESATLEREREKLHGLLAKTRDRLADPGFRDRAPKEVVREAEEKVAELTDRLQRIDEHLRRGVPEEVSP
jgi:valyl-tRNA synthetase